LKLETIEKRKNPMLSPHTILLPQAPQIEGLLFRNFEGKQDFPAMLETFCAAKKADQDEISETLEDMIRSYEHLTNCDPAKDVLIAEINGVMIGYSRVSWWVEENTGAYIYQSFGYIHPDWRCKGVGRAMLLHNQQRLRQIAAEHPSEKTKLFETFSSNFAVGNNTLCEQEGYQPIRRFYNMVRPNLENIPELELPVGLEVRPAKPEQYRQIWEASHEAFRDHWGYRIPSETDYHEWLESKEIQPDLWQVAWDGDQVAGMILNFINHAENDTYQRRRGYTEAISVRRPWRRRGLARALLARSLKMHRDIGMTEAALGVDSESLSGANVLYESMGFQVVKLQTTLRKPLT
jgi:mycothiol synthase